MLERIRPGRCPLSSCTVRTAGSTGRRGARWGRAPQPVAALLLQRSPATTGSSMRTGCWRPSAASRPRRTSPPYPASSRVIAGWTSHGGRLWDNRTTPARSRRRRSSRRTHVGCLLPATAPRCSQPKQLVCRARAEGEFSPRASPARSPRSARFVESRPCRVRLARLKDHPCRSPVIRPGCSSSPGAGDRPELHP